MTSLRRSLIFRFSGQYSEPFPYAPVPRTPAERFIDDDAASIRTVLPSYSESRHHRIAMIRPISPPPTYFDEPRTPTTPTSASFPPAPRSPTLCPNGEIDKQAAIDELISRLCETLDNPKAWRRQPSGFKTFFWALKCAAGTADILSENIDKIREKTIAGYDVQKFCFAFRGQPLGELACRPVRVEKYGNEAAPLKEDYIVVQLSSRF